MPRRKSPAINRHIGGWNQNPTWEYFASLVQATTDGIAAPNWTVRFQHVKAALYAAIGSLESFLNTTMHGHLKEKGVVEDTIRDHLRKPTFAVKVKKWPEELAGTQVPIPDDSLAAIFAWQKLRDEVTHPKVNHSVYGDLAAVALEAMQPVVAGAIVRILEARREIYPYWLLGWNFINEPEADEPILINNQQFMFALCHLGFDVPFPDVGQMEQWEEHFMTSHDGYLALDAALRTIDNCEARQPRFRHAPRLCKKWWDVTHTALCGD